MPADEQVQRPGWALKDGGDFCEPNTYARFYFLQFNTASLSRASPHHHNGSPNLFHHQPNYENVETAKRPAPPAQHHPHGGRAARQSSATGGPGLAIMGLIADQATVATIPPADDSAAAYLPMVGGSGGPLKPRPPPPPVPPAVGGHENANGYHPH